MKQVYLDYNASTPVAPEVAAAMSAAMEDGFGNPSSSHWAGVPARQTVEKARRQVADFLGCRPGEVVFTSGGSEANNFALKGAFFCQQPITPPLHHDAGRAPGHRRTAAFPRTPRRHGDLAAG